MWSVRQSVFTTKDTKSTKGQRTQAQCRNYEMRETREKGR